MLEHSKQRPPVTDGVRRQLTELMTRQIIQPAIQRQRREDLLTQRCRMRTFMQSHPQLYSRAPTCVDNIDKMNLAVREARKVRGDTGLIGHLVECCAHAGKENASTVLT